MNLINFGLAFLEGFALIISPCILPILPIMLSVGISGGKGRPYGMVLGFILAFCAFTLLSRQLILFLHINNEWLRLISFYLLIVLGIIMMSTYLSDKFGVATQSFADAGERLSNKMGHKGGFFNGLLLGLPIGLIWTPCAGPIIAAVIVQTVRQQTHLETVLTLLAFSIGAALPMLLLIILGKTMVTKMDFFKRHSILLRRLLGAIIVFTVIVTAQGELLKWPISSAEAATLPTATLENALSQSYPAPEIQGITAWINSPPLTLQQLKGKVVLIDFWTYSCINCIRTLPYITAWDKKYRDQGLVIIGVHAPEFAFEHDLGNVQDAVTKDDIHYPVALDNNFTTWDNYSNQSWPAHYLIDRDGNVVYTHFGEGDYDVTENNIRVLLGKSPMPMANAPEQAFDVNQTPETYLGSDRADRFANPHSIFQTDNTPYIFPAELDSDQWALQGDWHIGNQKITALAPGAAIRLHFNAKKVFLVLGSETGQTVTLKLLLNGKPIGNVGGKDVHNNQVVVNSDTLYELVNLPKAQDGVLEIDALSPGVEAYAFTFGGN